VSVPGRPRPWLAKYPTGVPADIEIPNVSLFELIQESVRRNPNSVAFIHYGMRWTYARFWEEAGRLAGSFVREGLRRGDRVALYLPNCPAYPIAYYAALRLGLVVVQVSPLYIEQDLERLLRDAAPRAIVALDIHAANLDRIAARWPLPLNYIAPLRDFYPIPQRWFVNLVAKRRGFSTRVSASPQRRRWKDGVARGPIPDPVAVDPATDVAVLQYTGGTTGTPKAAMLSHRNLVANVLQAHAWLGQGAVGHQVYLGVVPFFHVYGMTAALNQPLFEGASIVLETRPDVDEILRLIDKYHPTYFHGVPALYNAITQHPRRDHYDLRSIRICVSGSAPLPREVARRFEELTGGNLVEGYGLSETSPVTHVNPLVGERRAGSIGLPVPSTDQKVVDLETGTRELLPGEAGELCVRGPQVMLGYSGRPEETQQVLHDGWFHTGDIAYLDSDGYCYIIDRKKDMINVGGMKVYPRDVEEVLFQHPGVADVAVVGVPDARTGEAVKAFVVRKPGAAPTADELIGFVRERIAHFKAPSLVEFRDKLPRSGVQKVLRRELRAASGAPPAEAATGPAR
jgi:long-chain acyl-CoA synthetase